VKVCFKCMELAGWVRPEQMPDVSECGVCGGYGNVTEREIDSFTARRLKKAHEKWQIEMLTLAANMGPMKSGPDDGE
jgi:hypothetical protein